MIGRFVHYAAACLMASFISTSAFADSAPDDIIKYRKNVMKSIGAQTGALVAILKGEVEATDSLAAHAKAFSASANAVLITGAFKQNTDGQGSEKTTATAKIWSDWDNFAATAKKLEAAALEISNAAAEGKLTSFDQLKPALAQCGTCHKDAGYRTK
jgi:cytochrome c556